MKHPVWILNSALFILVLFAVGFIFFTRQKPPARADIEPSGVIKPLKGEIIKINISKIYENDLFGTYRKEFPSLMPGAVPRVPEPPPSKKVSVPPLPTPQFLEPLNIALKGIIIMLNDDAFNRAIIMDNKTNKEHTYRVGSMIEDAQIIQILSNKIILLRSNGQQEVLYLREKDAQIDPTYLSIDNWKDVIQKVSDTDFIVSPAEFASRVKNLAQFIDMLDLITVYKNGKSVGCRIGTSNDKSLGRELGLQAGDIIMSINNIPATDTAQRFKIYKAVVGMKQDDTIKVLIKRQQQEITLSYTLRDFAQPKATARTPDAKPASSSISPEELHAEQIKIMQQKHKFAPTMQQIREQERANMRLNGRAPGRKADAKTKKD